MLLISIIFLLINNCSQKLISSGDLLMPTQSSVFQDPRIIIKIFVDATNLTIWAKLNSFGYFGILYSPVMDEGDYSIIQFNNSTNAINIKDYHSPGGHKRPVEDKIRNVQLLGYQTNQLDYVIAKFTRYLNTYDSNDTQLRRGQRFQFSWAKRSNYLVLKSHKEDDLGIFCGILMNNQIFISSYDSQYKIDEIKGLKHGILLTFVWYVLADIAIIIKYFYKLKYRIQIHIGLFCLIILVTIYQIYDMLSNQNHHRLNVSKTIEFHKLAAWFILVWIVFQGSIGFINWTIQRKNGIVPYLVFYVRKSHKYSGLVLIIIAKLNIFIGWMIFDSRIILGLLLIWNFSIAYLYFKQFKKNIFFEHFNQIGIKEMYTHTKLIEEPTEHYYQYGNYVIFDNKVYDIDQNFIHPGGKEIIKLVKGRQIDRFYYGIERLQNYDKINRFTHPTNSIYLLGKPIYIFPSNQIYFLQSKYFNVHSQIRLTSQLSLIYLKSSGQRTIFEQKQQTIQHIGQYFKIQKFGITRLFSNVSCLRIQNKENTDKILQKINLHPHYQEKLIINNEYIQLKQKFYEKDFLIPLLIKRYDNGQFTSRFYQNLNIRNICVQGLKGRGLGIQFIKKGQILVIAGGTGLFPFLDLIDILFKIKVEQQYPQIQINLINYYKQVLKGYNFTFFISVKTISELVLVNQLVYLVTRQNRRFRLFLRVTQKNGQQIIFKDHLINQKFNLKFIRKFIQEQKLSKVLICGPTRLYQQVTQVIKQSKIQLHKIYYV